MSNRFGKSMDKWYFSHKEKENLPLKIKAWGIYGMLFWFRKNQIYGGFMDCFCDLEKLECFYDLENMELFYDLEKAGVILGFRKSWMLLWIRKDGILLWFRKKLEYFYDL